MKQARFVLCSYMKRKIAERKIRAEKDPPLYKKKSNYDISFKKKHKKNKTLANIKTFKKL